MASSGEAKPVKVGMKVEVKEKGLVGKIAFIGVTSFASGKWIGVVLSEPKGKNNGVVSGKKYFTCAPNHGLFVRQSQLIMLDEAGDSKGSTPTSSPSTTPSSTNSERKIPKPSALDTRRASEPAKISSFNTPKKKGGTKPAQGIRAPEVRPSPPPSETSQPESEEDINSEEVMNLRHQVKDLTEKLDTLKIRRVEDKAKLKELEKMKIQFQQHQEFKARMTEAKSDLERQLQEAKKEAREAVEAKHRHEEDVAEVAESIEMATLDKEMAEERADSLQQEVESLKEKNEELTLDLELLRSEIEQGGTEGAATNYQIKQLEQQNTRLKEALVRLRDLSTHEKQEYQTLLKEKEKIVNDNKEVKSQKDSVSKALKEAENQVIELKEQVDAALGAEEMVESLTEANLELEEKVQELQDNINDLEALADMNEEIQENARDTELELREERDMANSRVLDAQRKLEAMSENISDYQQTIAKFRELTSSLQDENRQLHLKVETANNSQESTPDQPAFDFKQKFAEAKAQAKMIELDIRKLEVEQAKRHIDLLCSFMADSFLRRGGDHDCIQVLLLLSRLNSKAEIVINQIKDKAEMPPSFEREGMLQNNKGEQLSFANTLIFTLYQLQAVLHKYQHALSTCSVELFCKIGTLFPEMTPYENSLDFYIEQLRKDQLDETTPLDALKKAITYFKHLYNVHLEQEEIDLTVAMEDNVKMITSASDCVTLETKKVKVLMQAMQETTDFAILMKDLDSTADDIKTFSRQIRRRLPKQGEIGSGEDGPGPAALMYGPEIQNSLSESADGLCTLISALRFLGKEAMTIASSLTGTPEKKKDTKKKEEVEDAEGIQVKKLEKIAEKASDESYGKSDKGPYQSFRDSVMKTMVVMSQVSKAMQEGLYDSNIPRDNIQPPIARRALKVKNEICDSDGLGHKLESRESEIKEFRRLLKLKQEEVSASAVRLGLIEKKLENANKETDDRVRKTESKLAMKDDIIKKKEKEFEETLDHMQVDIDALEKEKAELKQRLTLLSKKTLFEGITRTSSSSVAAMMSSGVGSGGSPGFGGGPGAKDSPLLLQKIESLCEALRYVRAENRRMKGEKLRAIMDELDPLNIPKKPVGLASPTGFVSLDPVSGTPAGKGKDTPATTAPQEDLMELNRKTRTLLSELQVLSACPKVIDITNRKPGVVPVVAKARPINQLAASTIRLNELHDNIIKLQGEMQQAITKVKPRAKVQTDFSAFAIPQYTKAQLEKSNIPCIGRISIPVSKGQQSESLAINLQPHQLRQLHSRLIM
ncbi:dynactin subunit 1-like isoform X3 [Anneissia japonica]|uniref:dynactin subunit 1-like isoform X3 n=1 Tax=Anneissia japonica TaxID=1529436 RepID=UPI001425B18E|nr:dynactin subunit 1-like isoform X3 [Anneissia japonica]